MKTILTKFYNQYFPEIMTGILVSLFVITSLLVFGIFSSRSQRADNNMSTSNKLDSIKTEQKVMKNALISKSDSIQESLKVKLDKINKQ
mgnify:FL=1